MDKEQAHILLERLGCRRIRVSGEEIICSCPFPGNHHRGDRRSSFSANIGTGESSPYFCFACHESGTLEGLAVRNGYTDLVPGWKPRSVKGRSWLNIPSTNAGVFGPVFRKRKRPVLFRDDYLEPFVGVLSGYLKKRGVSLETARSWELGLDKRFRRATFTVRDFKGRLAVVIGRDITGKSVVKYSNYVLDRKNKCMVPFIDHDREKDFIGPTKRYFLYGEHKAWDVSVGKSDRCSDDLIVVEGPIDVLRVWQMGWNVVGVLGSYPHEAQVEKLITMVPRTGRLVIMADGDESGRKLVRKFGEMIGGRVPVFDARLGDGMDPGGATEKEIGGALKNARMIGLTSVR